MFAGSIQRAAVVGLLVFVVVSCLPAADEDRYLDPRRWEDAINKFREWDSKNAPPRDPVLFVGSSSIVAWKTAAAFPELPIINRGFGGSTTADLIYYIEDLVIPYRPRVVVLYEGDNDIALGISPERVHRDFVELVDRIHTALPKTKIIYLATKLCRARWEFREAVIELNRLNKDYIDSKAYLTFVDTAAALLDASGRPVDKYFVHDRLHLSEKGYDRWNTLVKPVLEKTLTRK